MKTIVMVLGVVFLNWVSLSWGQDEGTAVISFDKTTKIKPEFVDVPVYGAGGTKRGGASADKKWMEVEFKYACMPVEMADLTSKRGVYLDEVQFKIYIEGIIPDQPNGDEGDPVLLVGEVTYVNIPAGKENYGVFYVHPNTVGRYGGQANFERSAKNIRIEAYVNGQLVDVIQKREEENEGWIHPLKRINNLVYSKEESPFSLMDIGRYPAEKKDRRN